MNKLIAMNSICDSISAGMGWNHQEQAGVPNQNQPVSAQKIAELREVARISPRFAIFEMLSPNRIKFKMHRTKDHLEASIDANSHAWAALAVAGLRTHGDCSHYTQHVPKISYNFDAAHSSGPLRQKYRSVLIGEQKAEEIVSKWLQQLKHSARPA